jgi:hypothetical protein
MRLAEASWAAHDFVPDFDENSKCTVDGHCAVVIAIVVDDCDS